jgi:hypothetical protein
MADDLIKVTLSMESEDVVRTLKNVEKLEREIGSLQAGYAKLKQFQASGNLTQKEYARGVAEVDSKIGHLTKVLSSGGAAINKHATYMTQAKNKMSKYGMVSQQVGYQVGDFFVQIQSGQNKMVAFTQQATQLAGLIPGIGGAVVGISLSLVGFIYQLNKTKGSTEEVTKAFDKVADSLKDLKDVSKDFDDALELPATKGNIALQDYLKTLKNVKNASAQSAFSDALKDTFAGYVDEAANLNKKLSARVGAGRNPNGGRLVVTGQERADMEERLASAVELHNEFKKIATGPIDQMTKKAIELESTFRNSGRLTKGLQDTFFSLLETSGLRAEYEAQITAQYEKQLAFLDKVNATEKALADTEAQRLVDVGKMIDDLDKQNALIQVALDKGVQSQQYADAKAKSERDAYLAQQQSYGTSADQLKILMESYDTHVAQKTALENITEEYRKIEGLVKSINSEVSSMGLSNAGLEAQLAALQAGAGTGESKIAGQIRAKAFELAPAMNNTDETISAEATAAFNQYVLLLNERLTLEQAIQVELDKRKAKPKGKQDALAAAWEELALQRAILGAEGARRAGIELLGKTYVNYSDKQIELLGKEKEAVDKIIAAERQRQQIADFVGQQMENAFMSIVDGTSTVEDAFKNMASMIIQELYRILVVQQMVNAATTAMKVAGWLGDGGAFSGGSALPNANGNGFSGGNVIPFASGGVVGSPTTFGMSGGRTGLMGEAGPEAIMPLQRGPNGKLGVTVNGGDGGGVTVNQVINISTGVQQTVRAEIKSMMPQIADNAKAAVLDAKRRGGSYGGAF